MRSAACRTTTEPASVVFRLCSTDGTRWWCGGLGSGGKISTHHRSLPGERLGADEHWTAGPPLCGRVSLGSLLSLSPRPLRRRWWSSGRPRLSAATVLRLR